MPTDSERKRKNFSSDFCGCTSCNICFETVIQRPKRVRKVTSQDVTGSFDNRPRLVKAVTKPVAEPTIADIQAQVTAMQANISDCLDDLLMRPATLSHEPIVTNKDYTANPSMHVYMNHETEKHRR